MPVFNLVGNKFALPKSVNEFVSIIFSRIATYFSPIAAYFFKWNTFVSPWFKPIENHKQNNSIFTKTSYLI